MAQTCSNWEPQYVMYADMHTNGCQWFLPAAPCLLSICLQAKIPEVMQQVAVRPPPAKKKEDKAKAKEEAVKAKEEKGKAAKAA